MAKRTRKTSSIYFNVGNQTWVLTKKGYVRLWDSERRQYSLLANKKSPSGTLPGGLVPVRTLAEAKALALQTERSNRFSSRGSKRTSPSVETQVKAESLHVSVKAMEFLEHCADTCGEVVITTSSKKAFEGVGLYLKGDRLYRGDEVFQLIDKS